MRARMAIAISGQQVEFREVILRDKPSSMIKLSPKGTVPVLSLSSGQVIDESLDVIDWALKLNDPDNWLRSNKSEKSLELIHTNDNEFKHHLDRYKYSKRYDNEDPLIHREKCLIFINELEEQLSSSQFLYDDKISALDISILPFIRQCKIANPKWFFDQNFIKVIALLDFFEVSDLFTHAMKKFDLWDPQNRNGSLFP